MFEITVYSHFSGAHRLRYLRGRCEGLHGHNWKIEVSVLSNRLNKEGIVLDFGILKQKVEEILKSLDHTYLNDLPFFAGREPSSENIAKYIFDKLKTELNRYSVRLKRVTAWESDTTSATYFGK
ncbi:MAG: 6-carboxytetrahydropterin synthase QueD [Deltaproteobacteria bacterium RBG_16_48_10]|nr:MAG: 6-carboxytetrahydropterin synthase QueD [Deltaproteobacteria bacterium RBG_16_48_10]